MINKLSDLKHVLAAHNKGYFARPDEQKLAALMVLHELVDLSWYMVCRSCVRYLAGQSVTTIATRDTLEVYKIQHVAPSYVRTRILEEDRRGR